jgi:four helix bundle protein
MQNFTQLKVWQKAHSFTVNLYKISSEFPLEEKFPKGYRFAYGLTNQIRRAAISIESNIAEGCGRDGDKEFNRFLSIAKGSCYEVQCQIYIARDLNYISHQKCDLIISKIDRERGRGFLAISNRGVDEILKMIYSLQKKLEAKSDRLEARS